jgi:hypothetical protein
MMMLVHTSTKESLENHTVQDLKDICGEKGLQKKGNKTDLIEGILSHQVCLIEEERKRALKLKERRERWKGFSFFKELILLLLLLQNGTFSSQKLQHLMKTIPTEPLKLLQFKTNRRKYL